MTPRRFQDDQGVYFPFTVLDDRAGRDARRGMYEMIDEGRRASTLKRSASKPMLRTLKPSACSQLLT